MEIPSRLYPSLPYDSRGEEKGRCKKHTATYRRVTISPYGYNLVDTGIFSPTLFLRSSRPQSEEVILHCPCCEAGENGSELGV